ncbi:MAG: hypothetical protein GXP30_02040 [Verrucomicrobia bacterium]|nr:hypothetical protein [Verrucomicrobiota bacterium]
MSELRYFELRMCLAVFGGLCFSLCPVSDTIAQDRPAVVRPSKNKALKTSQKEESAKASKSGEVKSGTEAEKVGPNVDIGKILPEGKILKGVKLPSYTGDRLSSLMTAVTMRRLDEKHLGMDEMRITMYAKPGEPNTLISTERGIYNLEREEITSDTRTLIEQDGVFDLEGDSMVFDANTQKGKMTGNVKMLLYNARESLMAPEEEEEPEIKKEEDGK